MARARTIKPAFFTNEYLSELPYEARLLFIGLWTLADRNGRLEDRPKRIKGALFPFDSFDADNVLTMLADSPERFIVRYEVDGQRYIQITNFAKHQHVHMKESAGTIPAPGEYGASTVQEPDENQTDPSLILNPLVFNPIVYNPMDAPPDGDAPPTTTTKRFIKPTIDEVTAYCRERGNNIDAQHFIDYYNANGWRVGRNPMKCWKSAIHTWEKNAKGGAPPVGTALSTAKNYDEEF